MPSSQIPNLNYATQYQQALEQAFPTSASCMLLRTTVALSG